MSTAYDPTDSFDPDPPIDEPSPEVYDPPAPDEFAEPPEAGEPTEEDARAAGWKPFEEFKGDPSLWRDWPEFLEHGFEDPRILRERNSTLMKKTARLERQLADANNRIGSMEGRIDELLGLARKANSAQYEERRAALNARRREAVEMADTSAFEEVEAQMAAMEAPPPAPEKPKKTEFVPAPAIAEFVAANPWWSTNPDLQHAMNAHYDIVMRTRKDLDMDQQLQLAKRRLMADFPEKFGGQMNTTPTDRRRNGASVVARPTGATGAPLARRRSSDPWAAIPDDTERATARSEFTRQQRYDPGLTEGEYLAIYLNPSADALELRRQRKKA